MFCKKSSRINAVNYFCKTLHLRCLTGYWICRFLSFSYKIKFIFNLFALKISQDLTKPRSSRRRCSIWKGVLRNFAKFTGKHLCYSLFFNKAAGLRAATLLKEPLAQVLSCEFCEISKSTFSYRTTLVAA